jgi:hypothetical protein
MEEEGKTRKQQLLKLAPEIGRFIIHLFEFGILLTASIKGLAAKRRARKKREQRKKKKDLKNFSGESTEEQTKPPGSYPGKPDKDNEQTK